MTPALHLSRVRLRHPIPSIHVVHALAAELAAGDGGRVLWALPLAQLLIVQGPRPATVTARCAAQVAEVACAVRPQQWEPGEQVVISLIACPTVMDGATRKRHTMPEADLDGWLTRKLAGALDLHEVRHQVLGLRSGHRSGARVSHRWVAYDGAGTVTDPGALAGHVASGVGSGKAYGGGLLLVGAA